MAQNYNVDDILEEIRRKKSREAAQDTYGQEAPPARAPAPQEDYRPRRAEDAQEPRRAVPRADEPYYERTRRPQRRPAAPQHAPQEERRSRLSGFGQEAQEAPRREEPPRRPAQGSARPRYDDYPAEPAPKHARPRYDDYPAEPALKSARPRYDDYPAEPAPKSARPRYDDYPAEPAPKSARPRCDDYPAEPAPKTPYDFESDSAPLPQGETLGETLDRLRRSRGGAAQQPAAPREGAGEGFTFRAAPEEPADDFRLPSWEDDAPPPEAGGFGFQFGFDAGTEPEPDGTRMDIPLRPRPRRNAPAGHTQEIDTAAPRRAREEGPQELAQSKWRQSYAEQELLEQEVPEDDFGAPEDAPYVEKDLRSIRTGLTVRQVVTAVLAFLSLYLTVSLKVVPFAGKLGIPEGYMLPLPPAVAPENNMRLFLIVNLVLVVLAAIVCSNIVGGGIAALCRMRANCDTPAALAVLAVLIQGIVLTVLPDAVLGNGNVSLYFPLAVVVLLFSLFGKKLMMKRIERNFATLTAEGDKYALVQIQNREFAREFSRGLGPDVDRVAYSARAGFITGFLDRSYSPDYSESFSNIASPICLGGALVVGIAGFFLMDRELVSAVSAFAAVLCICAPLSGSLVPNLMLARQARRLSRKGAMLAGYTAAEDYADTGAVVVSDRDLFSDDSVMLHGMKVFAEKRIDEAILDAASVIISCGGIMSGIFLNMIGGNRRMLKKVDSLMYEDGMGLSAWVDGKRVLIGSHELMRNHDIDCPSRDFEMRYTRDGRQVLYIANSGELSAMFVVSYNADPETADALSELERRGVSVALYTTDPNITSELVAAAFGVRRTSVRVLPAKIHAEYAFLTKPKERISAGGCHGGGLAGVLALVRAASAVRKSVMRATVVQLIGIVAGYGLVAFMAFTGSLQLASYGVLLLFGLAWYLITRAAASAGK